MDVKQLPYPIPRDVTHVLGVDESGTGSWAGSFYVAAVLHPLDEEMPEVKDSKTTKQHTRERLVQGLLISGFPHFEAEVTVDALKSQKQEDLWVLGAVEAVGAVFIDAPLDTTLVVVDGKENKELRRHLKFLGFRAKNVIFLPKADSRVQAVSAASIFAKYRRDQDMKVLDSLYPMYNFTKHSGYGTEEHVKAIVGFGVLPVHRAFVCGRLQSEKWSYLRRQS